MSVFIARSRSVCRMGLYTLGVVFGLSASDAVAQGPEMWHGHRRAAEVRPLSKVERLEPVSVEGPRVAVDGPEVKPAMSARMTDQGLPMIPVKSDTTSVDMFIRSIVSVAESIQRVHAIVEAHRAASECVAAVENDRIAGTGTGDEVAVAPTPVVTTLEAPGAMVGGAAMTWEQVAAIATAVLLAPVPVVMLLLVLIRQQSLPFEVTVVNGLPGLAGTTEGVEPSADDETQDSAAR